MDPSLPKQPIVPPQCQEFKESKEEQRANRKRKSPDDDTPLSPEEQATETLHCEWMNLSVVDLRGACRKHGLQTSGNKSVLAARLAETGHLPSENLDGQDQSLEHLFTQADVDAAVEQQRVAFAVLAGLPGASASTSSAQTPLNLDRATVEALTNCWMSMQQRQPNIPYQGQTPGLILQTSCPKCARPSVQCPGQMFCVFCASPLIAAPTIPGGSTDNLYQDATGIPFPSDAQALLHSINVSDLKKVKSHEFVLLARFLPSPGFCAGEESAVFDGGDGVQLVLKRHESQKPTIRISNAWCQAWLRFSRVAFVYHPLCAADYLAYQSLIIDLFSKFTFESVSEYDRELRYARIPARLPLAPFDNQLAIIFLVGRNTAARVVSTSGSQFKTATPARSTRSTTTSLGYSQIPPNACRRWNQNLSCTRGADCTYTHTCNRNGCGGQHRAINCSAARPANARAVIATRPTGNPATGGRGAAGQN